MKGKETGPIFKDSLTLEDYKIAAKVGKTMERFSYPLLTSGVFVPFINGNLWRVGVLIGIVGGSGLLRTIGPKLEEQALLEIEQMKK